MPESFYPGETVYCWRYAKDNDGNLMDPTTSFTITITDSINGKEVIDQDMIKDSPTETGKYHYYYTISEQTACRGIWTVIYKAVDGSHIVKRKDTFKVLV